MIARPSSGGTSARRSAIDTGVSVRCFMRSAGVFAAVNGGSPQSIW
jgi:hypothetical protein